MELMELGVYIIVPVVCFISAAFYYWNTFGFNVEFELYNRIEALKYMTDNENKEREKLCIIEQINYCETQGYILSKVRKSMLEALERN
jgi:hypothetical protein